MRAHHYRLQAFSDLADDLSCSVQFKQEAECFELEYRLSGDLSTVLIPAWDKTQAQQRQIGLWEQTCFECFLAVGDAAAYQEFNFSPTGAWNAFAFEDYRQAMQEDQRVQLVKQHSTMKQHEFSLGVQFICPALKESMPLALNLTAVLAHSDGQLSYWAIQHPKKPDFHLKTCFQYLA